MPITDILEKNCRLYGDDVCLVEINPEMPETKRSTWKEYDLIEPSRAPYYRREITWNVFNEKANRFANLLLERGVQKGDKVGILLMNCLLEKLSIKQMVAFTRMMRISENGSFGSTAELPLFSR